MRLSGLCAGFRTRTALATATLALLAAPTLAPVARAQGVTAEQGQQAAAQLRAWLGSMLGPSVPVDPALVRLTPAGDHFEVTVPLPVTNAADAAPVQMIGRARPIEGGKWAVEGMHVVSPLRFVVTMPVATAPKTPPQMQPVTFEARMDSQDVSGIIDPSFAGPTGWTGVTKGLQVHADNPHLKQDTRIAAINSASSIRPAGGDRLDVTSDGTMQGYSLSASSDATGPLTVSIDTARVGTAMTGLSRAHAAALMQGVAALASAQLAAPAPVPGAPPALPKIAPELARTLLAALQDLATEMTIDEQLDGIGVSAAGVEARLARAQIGFGGRSDAGLLRASFNLGLEQLTLPSLNLGDLAALLPQRVALRPFVGNVAVADLMRLASVSADGGKPSPQDINALFSHGGISTGLESLQVVVGGASFSGSAKVTVTDPGHANGAGQIVAEGFDALLAKVQSIPMLQQGVPVLLMAKGIGREANGKVRWDFTFDGQKLLVNGVDLMAMAGGAPKAAGPQPRPPRPARP